MPPTLCSTAAPPTIRGVFRPHSGTPTAVAPRRWRPEIGGRHSVAALLWSMTPPRDPISEELESLVLRFARFAGRIAHDRGLHQAVSYTHLRAHETGRNLVCR